jgi:hypothetical protein
MFHSCMLPNVMSGFILWLAMSYDFSSIHHHIACAFCREMMWWRKRDLIFRAKIHVSNHMKSEWLLCCEQTRRWYQNAQLLFCDKYLYSTRTHDLSSRKGAASKQHVVHFDNWQLLCSQKSGFNRLIWRRRHSPHATFTHSIHLIWLPMTSICFLQSKKNLNGFRWLMRTSFFWVCARHFEDLDQRELNSLCQAWVRRI